MPPSLCTLLQNWLSHLSPNTQVLSKANRLREDTETKTRLEPDTTSLYGIYDAKLKPTNTHINVVHIEIAHFETIGEMQMAI